MKISVRMMKGIVVLIGVLFVLIPLTAFTANKVVVIPLFDTTNPKPLKNIVTVAKANGMFTDPVAAVLFHLPNSRIVEDGVDAMLHRKGIEGLPFM